MCVCDKEKIEEEEEEEEKKNPKEKKRRIKEDFRGVYTARESHILINSLLY